MRDMCEYIQSLVHPTAQQVLNTVAQNNVCTGTQCYTNVQDAGFGNVVVHDNYNSDFMFALFIAFMTICLIITRPSTTENRKLPHIIPHREDDAIS
jgi:hypothetical protein